MTATCRLATILNADVVGGYSHLMGADEQSTLILAAVNRLTADGSGYSELITAGKEGMLERLKAHRREIIDPAIAEHCGRILKTADDGMLVGFPGPVEAVRCAVEMQKAILERNANTAVDARITFRIAVSLGDIAEAEALNISARLRALAEPGGLCISRPVRELIRDRLPYVFEDIGEPRGPKFTASVRAYAMSADAVTSAPSVITKPSAASEPRWLSARNAVIAASIVAMLGIWTTAWWSWLGPNVAEDTHDSPAIGSANAKATQPPEERAQAQLPTPAPAPAPSAPFFIVVLPFANLSDDPDQQYFADAVTDDLTSSLSRISGSFVIARNTAFAYAGKSVSPRQAGRQLGVRYVLAGSVRPAEDRVRIDARLIEVESGEQLWTERLETNRGKLAQTENEITVRVARTSGQEIAEPALPPANEDAAAAADAREWIMKGWSWYHRPYSTMAWQEARRDFQRALEIDPPSVDARIGLATILSGKLADGWSAALQQDMSRSEQLLKEVLARDPNPPAAHFAMGVLRQMQNRLPEAQTEYEQTIALDHNHARAYLHLGETLMFLGQPHAAVSEIEKAIRLDPRDPNISTAYWSLGTCYLLLGRVDEAIDVLKKARAANSRLWFPHLYLAGAYGLQGDLDDAKLALAEAAKLNPAITSLARLRGQNAWLANPQQWALQEETVNVGLRRAGLPEE
jgi:adenylate cyclase